jgi:hypothetical protein
MQNLRKSLTTHLSIERWIFTAESDLDLEITSVSDSIQRRQRG